MSLIPLLLARLVTQFKALEVRDDRGDLNTQQIILVAASTIIGLAVIGFVVTTVTDIGNSTDTSVPTAPTFNPGP